MSSLTVLTTAADIYEARLQVALLQAAGIPAILEGSNLIELWGMVQRMEGKFSHEVKVPTESLDAALGVLERARTEGAHLLDAPDGFLEVEPYDENAGFPSEEELAELVQKPAYNSFVLALAVLFTGGLVWFLIWFFAVATGKA